MTRGSSFREGGASLCWGRPGAPPPSLAVCLKLRLLPLPPGPLLLRRPTHRGRAGRLFSRKVFRTMGFSLRPSPPLLLPRSTICSRGCRVPPAPPCTQRCPAGASHTRWACSALQPCVQRCSPALGSAPGHPHRGACAQPRAQSRKQQPWKHAGCLDFVFKETATSLRVLGGSSAAGIKAGLFRPLSVLHGEGTSVKCRPRSGGDPAGVRPEQVALLFKE